MKCNRECTVTFRLNDAEYAALKIGAEQSGRSLSDYARKAVVRQLNSTAQQGALSGQLDTLVDMLAEFLVASQAAERIIGRIMTTGHQGAPTKDLNESA